MTSSSHLVNKLQVVMELFHAKRFISVLFSHVRAASFFYVLKTLKQL